MRVLMLLDNPFVADRRVRNEASSLVEAGHRVTLVATGAPGLPESETHTGVEVRRLIEPQLFDVKRWRYRDRLAKRLSEDEADVIHCHDHWMLDLGVRVKKRIPRARLVYDSHELFRHWPLNLPQGAGSGLRLKSRIVRTYCVWREQFNSRHIDRLVTVNDSLAHELASSFRLGAPPVVIRNMPPTSPVPAGDTSVRRALGLPATQRLVVCIGARLHPGTLNIEQVMEELAGCEGVALVLIAGDHKDLRMHATLRGYRHVYFHGFVPPERVTAALSGCDVGLVSTWNRRDLSYWYALDNKLFEYVAAGLPVLATQQPEYLKFVEQHALGICVDPDQPGAYAKGLRKLLADYPLWRKRVAVARRILTWEAERERLLAMYAELAAATE